ncbi:MAG: hypothetical protein ABIY55_25265 [Kofleriaceae bacterium]
MKQEGEARAVSDIKHSGPQPSVGTGDPNPRGFVAGSVSLDEAVSAIGEREPLSLTVPQTSPQVSLQIFERYGGDPSFALKIKEFVFELKCDPADCAGIAVTPDTDSAWQIQESHSLNAEKTIVRKARFTYAEPQVLNEGHEEVSLPVKLDIIHSGTAKLIVNVLVVKLDGGTQDISGSKFPTVITVVIE